MASIWTRALWLWWICFSADSPHSKSTTLQSNGACYIHPHLSLSLSVYIDFFFLDACVCIRMLRWHVSLQVTFLLVCATFCPSKPVANHTNKKKKNFIILYVGLLEILINAVLSAVFRKISWSQLQVMLEAAVMPSDVCGLNSGFNVMYFTCPVWQVVGGKLRNSSMEFFPHALTSPNWTLVSRIVEMLACASAHKCLSLPPFSCKYPIRTVQLSTEMR